MTEDELKKKFCIKCKQPRDFIMKSGYKVCPVCGIKIELKKVLIYLSLLTLPALACGMQLPPQAANMKSNNVKFPSLAPAPIPHQSEMVVCVPLALNVRQSPNGAHAGVWLNDGDIVTVTGAEEDGWTPIVGGWVKSRYLCEVTK